MTLALRALPVDREYSAEPAVGLYIHVPFCISLCPYCDFVVYPGAAARGAHNRIAAFVDALLREIDLRAGQAAARFGTRRRPLETVYLGGGTPSLLSAEQVDRILRRVRDSYGVTPDAEVTLEANPGPSERGDLASVRDAGVTRVSFGAQSLDDAELRRLGRRHRAEHVADAVAAARRARITSVNLDLLYDIPGQTLEGWAQTLDAALGMAPDHLSLYALALDDPGAEGLTGPAGDHLPTPPGARRWRDRARTEQDEDRAAAQYEHAVGRLAAHGWRGYEISNWARPGHESRHNLAYWRRLPCDAVGPGAHAFDGRTRRWNAARLDAWAAAIAAGRLPPGGAQRVGPREAAAERLILGLRIDAGVCADEIAPWHVPVMAWAAESGLAERAPDGNTRLTTRGRLLSNEVFTRLL
jgi:putative oxygen-independent coproporphyrinogen III oxidase